MFFMFPIFISTYPVHHHNLASLTKFTLFSIRLHISGVFMLIYLFLRSTSLRVMHEMRGGEIEVNGLENMFLLSFYVWRKLKSRFLCVKAPPPRHSENKHLIHSNPFSLTTTCFLQQASSQQNIQKNQYWLVFITLNAMEKRNMSLAIASAVCCRMNFTKKWRQSDWHSFVVFSVVVGATSPHSSSCCSFSSWQASKMV